jgi:hypothetical protein
MDVVLVGELNPRGRDPRYALFDLPVNAAGWRLRTKVLQVHRRTYFTFKRHNLCVGKWSRRDAEREAARLYLEEYDSRKGVFLFVLLGRKVADAFGCGGLNPFTHDDRFLLLPHPSGRCREWNDPAAGERARSLLREVVPDVVWGEAIL